MANFKHFLSSKPIKQENPIRPPSNFRNPMNPNPKNCKSLKHVDPEPDVNQQSQTQTQRILNPIHQ